MSVVKYFIVVFAALGLRALSLASGEGDLFPGSRAPKLDVKTWVKGNEVKKLESGKTYVVEFWATWCGPCIETIPHVSKLAKKYPDVTFIGVSILEENDDKRVQDFVSKMGSKMDYNVGYGGNKNGMNKSWFEPARQTGIPTAFIVKDGTIMWIGHPVAMEAPLIQIQQNKFDIDAARKGFEAEIASRAARLKLEADLLSIEKQYDAGDKPGARARLDEIESTLRGKASAKDLRFKWLAIDDFSAWQKRCLQEMEVSAGERDRLSMFISAYGATLSKQCKWLLSELINEKYPPDWYPYLCGARMFRQLKEYDSALSFCSKSKQIILDFQASNPTLPKGNALEVIQDLVNQIEKDKKG